jgi:tetratricopeptide (TPR) repeat protein
MRKVFWLLALLTFVGCSSAKKDETAAVEEGAEAKAGADHGAGVTAETKPMIAKATKLVQSGNLGKAFDQLNETIKSDPKCAAAYFMRAGIFADAGQNQKSAADFTTALELDPNNADFHNARGFFYLTRQDIDSSLKDFSAALKLNPQHAQSYNNRGLAYVARGKFKEAIADFTQAVKLGPKNHDALNNRGFAHFQLNEFEAALADFNGATKLNPQYLNAYNNKGLLFFKQEKYAEAAEQFSEASKRDRLNAKYYRHRREAYLKAGMEKEARADLVKIGWLQDLARINQVVTRTQQDPAVWVLRGNHLFEGGETEAANADFSKSLQLDPKHVPALIGRTTVLIKQGNWKQALVECDKAIELKPQSEALSLRGDVLVKLNRLDESIAAYAEAQCFDAKVAEAYLLRSKQRKAAGDESKAAEDYRQAMSLDPSLETSRN